MKNTQPFWNTASHTSSAHAHLLARGRGVATPRFPSRYNNSKKKSEWLGTEDEATFKCETTTLLQTLWPGVLALRIGVPFSPQRQFPWVQ